MSEYTGPIFAIFSPYESRKSALCADYYLHTKRLFSDLSNWVKRESNEGGLIPRAFFCTSVENDLLYQYLYVCVNSSDDQATSDINLVGF